MTRKKLDYVAKDRVTRDALVVAEGDISKAVQMLKDWDAPLQAAWLEDVHRQTASAGTRERVRTRKSKQEGTT